MSMMSDIIRRIQLGGQAVMSDIIADLIKTHEPALDLMRSNYKRYMASRDPDGVPVFSRRFEDTNKVNNKINNAFDADIIDVKVGYMLGNPIIYALDKEKYTEKVTDPDTGSEKDELKKEVYKADMEVIEDFNKRNNVEDLDGETLKMAAICAYGARLLYIGKDGVEYVTGIRPWECVFVEDGSMNEVQYAMRYYEITDEGKKRIYVEWYDNRNVYYYISTDDTANRTTETKLKFIPYNKDGYVYQPHMFSAVPLLRFKNNEELQGDCDKVYALIDGYDTTMSDVNSELEQFRLAYMAFYGLAPDEETMKAAKRTGAFGLPDAECKVEFIVKALNDNIVEHHLDRTEDNIYKFAKSVNFKDEAFGGNVSGVAMKFKMFGLESKCIMSERKFTAALRSMYRILASVWEAKGRKIDYMGLDFVWTRNFPLNLLDESQTTMNLKGNVSDKTRLSLLSFVDDVNSELEQMKQEEEESIDLDMPEEQFDEFGNPKGGQSISRPQVGGAV